MQIRVKQDFKYPPHQNQPNLSKCGPVWKPTRVKRFLCFFPPSKDKSSTFLQGKNYLYDQDTPDIRGEQTVFFFFSFLIDWNAKIKCVPSVYLPPGPLPSNRRDAQPERHEKLHFQLRPFPATYHIAPSRRGARPTAARGVKVRETRAR